MARKRKSHKNRRHARRSASSLGNPRSRRHVRRHSNRKRRGFRLFNPGPSASNTLESLAAALIAGSIGYVSSKGIGILAATYLPPSVPYGNLIGTGGAAIAAALLSEKFLKDRPKVAAGATVGAMIPFAEELIGMTPLGPMIGIAEVSDSGSSSASLPAPGGMSGRLMASLAMGASLADSGDDDSWDAASY